MINTSSLIHEWYCFNRTTATPDWGDIWGTELYNHTEPVLFFNDENVNLAEQPPEIKSMIEGLRQIKIFHYHCIPPSYLSH